jgi:hypothetical protein
MAELTDNASTPDCIFGTKAGSNNCKSDPTMSAGASPLNPLLYVRYKDHVIYKNILQPAPEAIERETVGWLTHQNQDIILIEHDRTIKRKDISSGKSNGIIILKSCILEARPLQKNLNWHLNSPEPTSKGEYAFRPTERKTHSPKSKGEKKP